MSTDKSPNQVTLPTPPQAPTLYSQVWSSITSLVVGGQGVGNTKKKTTLDMQDITYLMDMDGEGLCYNQMNRNEQAFKKQ